MRAIRRWLERDMRWSLVIYAFRSQALNLPACVLHYHSVKLLMSGTVRLMLGFPNVKVATRLGLRSSSRNSPWELIYADGGVTNRPGHYCYNSDVRQRMDRTIACRVRRRGVFVTALRNMVKNQSTGVLFARASRNSD